MSKITSLWQPVDVRNSAVATHDKFPIKLSHPKSYWFNLNLAKVIFHIFNRNFQLQIPLWSCPPSNPQFSCSTLLSFAHATLATLSLVLFFEHGRQFLCQGLNLTCPFSCTYMAFFLFKNYNPEFVPRFIFSVVFIMTWILYDWLFLKFVFHHRKVRFYVNTVLFCSLLYCSVPRIYYVLSKYLLKA